MPAHRPNRLQPCGALLLLIATLPSCESRSATQAQRLMPDANAPVDAYGLTLDAQASPTEVVWALTMAIRDDVRNPFGSPQWEQAMKLQCQLANVDLLKAELLKKAPNLKAPESLIYELILNWAPMLNYYADYFEDDYASAAQKMTAKAIVDSAMPEGRQDVQVVMLAVSGQDQGDTTGPPRGIRIAFKLAKTDLDYWRVIGIVLGPPSQAKTQMPASGDAT